MSEKKTTLSLVLITVLVLVASGCTEPSTQRQDGPGAGPEPESADRPETTLVDGWWQMGDTAGPFTAELRGGDIVAVDRELSHGEYGATRDRFEFASGRLVRYLQDSELRLMDSDDPSRLVPVEMRLDFGPSGELSGGDKAVDGARREIDPADADRVLAQMDDLVERVQAFAHVHAAGREPVRFQCSGDRSMTITFGDDSAVLDLGPDHGKHVLNQQPSASGAKYGNEIFVFWNKGDEAMVERFGEPFMSGCTVVD